MKYRAALNGVEFFAFHGLYPEEKLTGTTFIVNMHVEQEISDDAPLDTLEQVVNYEQLFAITKREMEHPRHLIETVAKSILDDVAKAFPGIHTIGIEIIKLNPGGLFKNGSASIVLSKTFV